MTAQAATAAHAVACRALLAVLASASAPATTSLKLAPALLIHANSSSSRRPRTEPSTKSEPHNASAARAVRDKDKAVLPATVKVHLLALLEHARRLQHRVQTYALCQGSCAMPTWCMRRFTPSTGGAHFAHVRVTVRHSTHIPQLPPPSLSATHCVLQPWAAAETAAPRFACSSCAR